MRSRTNEGVFACGPVFSYLLVGNSNTRTQIEFQIRREFMKTTNNHHQPQQRAVGMRQVFIAAVLIVLSATQVVAQPKEQLNFVNVIDTTQGLHSFSEFAAINDRGSVVFEAIDGDGKQGVFKSRAGTITTIVSESNSTQKDFADAVINDTDLVAYAANPSTTGNNRAIFTSDGVETKNIVDAKQQGLV